MRAIVHDAYGPPDVLRVAELDDPVPGEGEVLVRVRAAGVDAGVWHATTGRPYLVRAGTGLLRPKARVPGIDLAGTVEALGPGVTRWSVGDEVFGGGHGSFAALARAPQDRLARRPAGWTVEQAAATPVSGTTALQALRDGGRLRAGGRVLVIGAAGGVGSFAVQLGVALGAEVTGVCSTSKVELVRALGAARVVDYTRESVFEAGEPFDVVLDLGGRRPLALLRRLVVRGGTLLLVGGEGGGRWLGGTERWLGALLLSPFVPQRLRPFVAALRGADLEALGDLGERGALAPVVERVLPLEHAVEALRRLEGGHGRGKLVLAP